MLLGVLLAGCGSTPTPPAQQDSVYSVASRLTNEQATDVTVYALGLVGTPYRFGGNTPQSGFDCSGLIGHVYQTRAGLQPPRTVVKLQEWGKPVPVDAVRTGDLVLFSTTAAATHAGIYVGGGRFVHAPSTGGEVRLEYLSAKHWAAQRVWFRRP